MLTVQKSGRTRSTERAVEQAWARTWADLGIYSRHMSDAVPGLPDRYIAGGRWVEFKSLWRKKGGFTIGEGLSPEQRRTAAELLSAGDQVFYIAQLDGWEAGKRFIVLPMGFVLTKLGISISDKVTVEATADNRRALTQRWINV